MENIPAHRDVLSNANTRKVNDSVTRNTIWDAALRVGPTPSLIIDCNAYCSMRGNRSNECEMLLMELSYEEKLQNLEQVFFGL